MFVVTDDLRARLSSAKPTDPGLRLPVVASYPSRRFSENGYFGEKERTKPCPLDGRLSGYRNYLNPLRESALFNVWYRDHFLDVKEKPVIGSSRPDSPLRQLAAVRTAVADVLQPTCWGNIDWDKSRQCVVAEHPYHGRMPLASLSSGVRNMIAVTADLAHRCARLNPALGNDVARETPGVVLIDEVDLHLHPAWQQQVVELLRATFPAIQFVLTTHSPQVLSTVNSESIRVVTLRDGDGRHSDSTNSSGHRLRHDQARDASDQAHAHGD
ncbi:MAG: AAA family ATPase [Planctomycetes bacterium]|nr:AAA family ATPase [Planctomycetota bacterium]